METIDLKIIDETLRDGEQQAGLFFSNEVKYELAHLIAKTGAHYITLMPTVDRSEEQLVKGLVAEGFDTVLACSTMAGKRFIDHSKSCGVRRITLFHAVSDRLMFLRDNETRRSALLKRRTIDDNLPPTVVARVRQRAYEKLLDCIRYATSPAVGLEVDFAAEDASRADFDFLTQCIRGFRHHIGHFLLCDTVGVLSPDRTYRWINDLVDATEAAPLGIHFHNDLGLAVENTIQAVAAGATMVSGTMGGIGERAGNAALEQVLNGLQLRFGVEVDGIHYDRLEPVVTRLQELGGVPAKPYSKAASRHETGIHVNSFLRDPRSYSTFSFEEPEVWFGKCSGASNFQFLFENRLHQPKGQEIYNRMRARIKALSIQQQRCFSAQEVLDLYKQGLFNEQECERTPVSNTGEVAHETNDSLNGTSAQRSDAPRKAASDHSEPPGAASESEVPANGKQPEGSPHSPACPGGPESKPFVEFVG